MGVIQTNQWLEKDFKNPLKWCQRLVPHFEKQNADEIYKQLLFHGVYQPSGDAWNTFEWLVEQNMWKQIKKMHLQYQKKWSGPDIPIFIFPLRQTGGIFRRQEQIKSGLSFPDKMFLFLSKIEDPKEIEAVFVHEYHHVCRLSKLNKKLDEYTLLDSMMMEGLAEYVVLKNCGKEYNANWCYLYSDQEIHRFFENYLKSQLKVRKNERIHHQLLYGGGRFPKQLGYATGFSIVKNYYKNHHYSTKISFSLPSKKIMENFVDFR